MSRSRITLVAKGVEYLPVGEDKAYIVKILDNFHHLHIPTAIIRQDGREYTIMGFREFSKGKTVPPAIVTFDETSEITQVPASFIIFCKSKISLPPKIKRVQESYYTIKGDNIGPVIECDKDNRFVSVINKRSIINNHPHELLIQHPTQAHLTIRETTRIIGRAAFIHNQRLQSVVFPPSVEVINCGAFEKCINLRKIVFKGKSRLRKIGDSAFNSTSLVKVSIPPLVEEIGSFAFTFCETLESVSFQGDSKLKIIELGAFTGCAISSIKFPSSIEEIGKDAFSCCMNLSSVSFPEKEDKIRIGKTAFSLCPCRKSLDLEKFTLMK